MGDLIDIYLICRYKFNIMFFFHVLRGVKPSKGTHDIQPTVHIVGSVGFIDRNLSVLQM